MSTHIRTRLSVAAMACTALLLAACAQTPSTKPDASATAKAHASVAKAPCLTTGTRIALKNGECASSSGRVYTQEELQNTGEIDMAAALRHLDPSLSP